MIYMARNKLTVLTLDRARDSITFRELILLLRRRLSNTVYFETRTRFYGLVSMEDIYNAANEGQNYVDITTRLTLLYEHESMRARHLFNQRPDIFAIPSINLRGRLMGSYVRRDDSACQGYMDEFLGNLEI